MPDCWMNPTRSGNELSHAVSNPGNELMGKGSPRTRKTTQQDQPGMEPSCNLDTGSQRISGTETRKPSHCTSSPCHPGTESRQSDQGNGKHSHHTWSTLHNPGPGQSNQAETGTPSHCSSNLHNTRARQNSEADTHTHSHRI